MTRRFPRFSSRTYAYLAGGLLIGAMFTPAAAQQFTPTNGQVVVRSDGAVYLIANGQRRWVATVQITDDELNAYPEAEPIYTALAPFGAATTASSGTPPQTAAAPPSAAASPASAAPKPAAAAPPSAPVVSATDVLIEVDIDGSPKYEAGERIRVAVKTTTSASCSLIARWPNGTEADQGNKTPDSRGHCEYSFLIPSGTPAGTGFLKGIVRDGGKSGEQEVEFEILVDN
jgi:hypothetical protein